MSDLKYRLWKDSHNRICAKVGESITIGIGLRSGTDPQRLMNNVHAYAVLDIRTERGVMRIRDIKIMWSQENERYFLRWRQWPTGKQRDGRREYLDVAGPLDQDTRKSFEEDILSVFYQVREESQRGALTRDPESRHQPEDHRRELESKELTPAASEA